MTKRTKRVLLGISILVTIMVVATTSCITASVVWPMSGGEIKPKEDDSFRLMTLNIAHGRGLALDQRFVPGSRFHDNLGIIGQFLQEAGADIVAMQEVDENSDWNGNFNHLNMIHSHTDFTASAFGVNNVNKGRYALSYGNALLSRYNIVDEQNHPFGSSTLGEKGFLYTVLEINGRKQPIINTHLDFKSRAKRISQVNMIIAWLEEERARDPEGFVAPIVMGDFNSRRTKPLSAVNFLIDYLHTLCDYTISPDGDNTFPTYEPTVTIDYIFIPGHLEVRQVQVPRVKVSDHLPVIIDFTFREILPVQVDSTPITEADRI